MAKLKVEFIQDNLDRAKQRRLAWRNNQLEPNILIAPEMGVPKQYNNIEICEEPEKGIEDQCRSFNHMYNTLPETDTIPVFRLAFLGEGIIPSMFGAKQVAVKENPPFIEGRLIQNLETDLDRLPEHIEPEHTEWGKKLKRAVLAAVEYGNGEIPVSTADHQSPYGLATKLMDNEALMLAMFDTPELVKKFFHICEQATIDTIHAMEKWAGNPDIIAKNIADPLPGGGLIIWDDYISVISPAMHQKFCLESNMRLFREFSVEGGGKGHLHTCGPYFPGFIDAVLAHDVSTIDISRVLRERTHSREDLLLLKQKADKAGVKLKGPLWTNDANVFESKYNVQPDRALFKEMLKGEAMLLTGCPLYMLDEIKSWVREISEETVAGIKL